jgi:RNA polymerase sigma-70 factor (ECF subfamily)
LNRAAAPGHYLRRDKLMAVRLVRFIRRLATPQGAGHDPDAQLLGQFAASRDECAFAALLKRHGSMVLAVCRRVLNDEHDAEDAFQATFLVLARKAGAVRRHASVASWLYGVAHRTALKARAQAARRRRAEREAVRVRAAEPDAARGALWRDLRPVLDEEVARLPEKNRVAFVLCYLEGRTTAEAAQALACPRGTVLSRLAWARARLRAQLARRGLALSAGLLAGLLSPEFLSAAVPPTLFAATAQALPGALSAQVIALTEGVLRAMWLTKLRAFAAALGVLAVLGAAGLFAYGVLAAGERTAQKGKSDQERLQGTWALVSEERGGKLVEPPEGVKGATLTFQGDRVSFKQKGGGHEASFKVDPTRTPKEIDLTVAQDGKPAVHKGLYALEGDTLKLCLAHPPQPRPTAFASAAGEQWPAVFVFKRK